MSFGFGTAVVMTQEGTHAAVVKSHSIVNSISVIKLMGHYSGKLHCLQLCMAIFLIE